MVAGLKEVPLVNASLDEEKGEIVLHDSYHVGIAVATPAGLIVPVLRDADRKDLGTLAREVERLSDEARSGRVKLEDLRGGTFTVTSVGNLGGHFGPSMMGWLKDRTGGYNGGLLVLAAILILEAAVVLSIRMPPKTEAKPA